MSRKAELCSTCGSSSTSILLGQIPYEGSIRAPFDIHNPQNAMSLLPLFRPLASLPGWKREILVDLPEAAAFKGCNYPGSLFLLCSRVWRSFLESRSSSSSYSSAVFSKFRFLATSACCMREGPFLGAQCRGTGGALLQALIRDVPSVDPSCASRSWASAVSSEPVCGQGSGQAQTSDLGIHATVSALAGCASSNPQLSCRV